MGILSYAVSDLKYHSYVPVRSYGLQLCRWCLIPYPPHNSCCRSVVLPRNGTTGHPVPKNSYFIQVIMPKYDCLKYDLVQDLGEVASFNWDNCNIRVFRGKVEGLETTFLEPNNGYFWVGCVYGRNDDAHRFGFFCGAALEYLKHHAPQAADIVHCHDWPTAPVAFGDVGTARCVSLWIACHKDLRSEFNILFRNVLSMGESAGSLCGVLVAGACSPFPFLCNLG
jgi:hypothetical protein